MPWQSVPRANFMFLHAARLQAHYATQWLGRAARAYVPAEPHDRHTSLGWDDAFGGLTTHPLPDGSRLGLRIADLTLLQARELSAYLREVHHIEPTSRTPEVIIHVDPEPVVPTERIVQVDAYDPNRKLTLIKTVREFGYKFDLSGAA